MEDGRFRRLDRYIGMTVTEEQLLSNGFIRYCQGHDLAQEVAELTGQATAVYEDEDEAEAIRSFFGEDVWMKYVPMSDRELKGNQIYDASFLLGINVDEKGCISCVREFVRIGIPFAGELPMLSGMPVPLYYDYMPINYCPRYVAEAMEELMAGREGL